MKLPRHDRPRNVVSELTSLRNIMISPQEAANLQLAKYGAIAEGAKAIGDVAKGIAEIQADEEYINSTLDFEDAAQSISKDVEAYPGKIDETGAPTFDPDKMIKMELDARKAVGNAIYGNMKSGIAKRKFQSYLAQRTVQLNEDFQRKIAIKNTEVLKTSAQYKIDGYIRDDRFPEAKIKAQTSYENGVFTAAEWDSEKNRINIAKDTNVVTDIQTNPNATRGQLQVVADSLRNGIWDPSLGVEDPVISLDDGKKTQFWKEINNRIAGFDEVNESELKAQQERNYRKMAQDIRSGKNITVMDVYDLPPEFMSNTRVNDLVSQIDVGVSYTDNLDTKRHAEDMLMTIRHKTEDMDAALEGYNDWVYMRDDLTTETKNKLMDDATKLVDKIFKDPVLNAALDAEIAGLIDVTQQRSRGATLQDDREERVAAKEMTRDFYNAALAKGNKFDPDKWLKDNAPKYYEAALSASFAELGILDIGSVMVDGKLDRDKVFTILQEEALSRPGNWTPDDIERLIDSKWKKVNALARRMNSGQ